MTEHPSFEIFPKSQIKPYDGMPVTAEVWGMAHNEHRQARQAHDLVFHGSGVVCGLEVQANDPADQYVFISPGVAVDPVGNVIVLTEPIAYDFGNATEGELYLLIGSGERELDDGQNEIRQVQKEFVIAARPAIPRRPVVELARVHLTKRGNPIHNPLDPAHPGLEEIDMRFRRQVGPPPARQVRVAVCSLGGELPPGVTAGWGHLARECKRATGDLLIVDAGLPITADLLNFGLLYLAVSGPVRLEVPQLKALRSAVEGGRGLLVEAFDAPAADALQALWSELGLSLSPIPAGHPLLHEPYLFNAPPEGSQGSQVQMCGAVVYSTAGYSLAWAGQVAAGNRSDGNRAAIRTAHEWGVNLVSYLAH